MEHIVFIWLFIVISIALKPKAFPVFAYCLGTVEHVHLEIVDLSIYFAIGQSILCTCRLVWLLSPAVFFESYCVYFVCMVSSIVRLKNVTDYVELNSIMTVRMTSICGRWRVTHVASWAFVQPLYTLVGVTLISHTCTRNIHPDRAWLRHVHELPDRYNSQRSSTTALVTRVHFSCLSHCFITIRLTGQGQWRLLWINTSPSLFR